MAGKNETVQITQDKAITGVLAMLVAEREDRLGGEGTDERTTRPCSRRPV